MTRALRIDFPSALYHVTSRGNEQRPIFRHDSDRLRFLDFLRKTVERFGWSLTAWVLMDNHFHLVTQTAEANVSRGMHWLNGTYARWFNHRHQRTGHLFQGRFKAFLIEKETYFEEVLRYVVLNPVRAKMVAKPEEHIWSSYRQTVGLDPAATWLDVAAVHAQFDRNPAVAKRLYRDFVMTRVDGQDRLWDQVTNGMYLGSDPWAREMRALVESTPRSTDYPIIERAVGRPAMPAILEAVSQACGESPETIRSTRGCAARDLAAWVARNEGLITLRSIAAALRLRSEGHVSALIRRCESEFDSNARRVAELDRTMEILRA
jgi:putative transposase